MSLKNYKKAIEYLNEAQQTFQNLNLDYQTAIVMEHTGNAYAALNDFKNAEYYFQNSLKLSQQLGLKPTTIEAAKGLYTLYKKQGNYQKSLKYFVDILTNLLHTSILMDKLERLR
jgi:tetratricopeptide (TPR) repeat protein